MRLLVACPKCGQQYDASEQPVGSQFRCACGESIVVRHPEGHDAAVVRCSSCGAPRQGSALSCEFCGAAFTLHDRDLNTICPHCMARVSDRAKFCHCCGTGLASEPVAVIATDLACPACQAGQRLHSRQIGGINVMECDRCAGLWLSAQTFERLSELAASDALGKDLSRPATPAADQVSDTPAEGGPRYRPCPVCGGFMNRINYGWKSGVIVDVCKKDGAWFDADELARILAWIREGGLLRASRQRADDAQADLAHVVRQQHLQAATMHGPIEMAPPLSIWETGSLASLLWRFRL